MGFTGWTAPTTRQVLTSSYELSAVPCSARPTQGTMYSSTNLAPCKLTHVPRPCCAPKLRNRQVDGNMRCYRTHNRKSCYKFIRRRHLRRCTCVPEIQVVFVMSFHDRGSKQPSVTTDLEHQTLNLQMGWWLYSIMFFFDKVLSSQK